MTKFYFMGQDQPWNQFLIGHATLEYYGLTPEQAIQSQVTQVQRLVQRHYDQNQTMETPQQQTHPQQTGQQPTSDQ